MSRLCLKLTLAIGVSLLAGLLAVPAIGQTPTPGIRIAVVNVKRINDDFVRSEAEKDNTQDWARQQQEYLDELRTKYMFLSQEAFDEAVEILRQPRPLTAKSLKRQKELRDVNDQNEDRYLELQAKLDRTAQEQDEFNRLQAGVDAREEQIKTIMSDLQRQLDGRQQQSYERIMETVQQTINQVAAAAKYDLVLNKLIVVYGGDDITDIVLERLTGKPVATSASPVSPTVAPTPAPAPAPTPAPAPAPTPAPAPAPGAGG